MSAAARAAPIGRVLVAPNAFKGSLTAREAAAAIKEAVVAAWPGIDCRALPLADGGDGFLDAIVGPSGGEQLVSLVSGPLLEPVPARVGWPEAGPKTAVIELAQVCGIRLVESPSPETAGMATTRGLGELLLATIDRGAERVLVGLGGSASSDGGAGLAQALGFQLLDRHGDPIRPGGLGLRALERIVATPIPPRLRGLEVVAACDVRSPLLGPLGAAAVFGPQKGADPETAHELEQGLGRLAQIVARDLIRPPNPAQPGMGAAGGTAFGLAAFCAARLESGVELVADWVGLDRELAGADLVITGEGRFDAASLEGKVTGEVLRRSSRHHIACVVITGSAEPAAVAAAQRLGGRIALIAGEPAPDLRRSRAQAHLKAATKRFCQEFGRPLRD
ncbi:MAG TPA: glycerate kinase [Candidatus Dormibacteraeota bacterium]|nr:glycerate kinase [Candidatus Dormibacteraeota bacterium]